MSSPFYCLSPTFSSLTAKISACQAPMPSPTKICNYTLKRDEPAWYYMGTLPLAWMYITGILVSFSEREKTME